MGSVAVVVAEYWKCASKNAKKKHRILHIITEKVVKIVCTYYILLSFLTSIKAISADSLHPPTLFVYILSLCLASAFDPCKLLQSICSHIVFPALHFRFWIVVGSFKLACHVFLLLVLARTLYADQTATEWKVSHRNVGRWFSMNCNTLLQFRYIRWWRNEFVERWNAKLCSSTFSG